MKIIDLLELIHPLLQKYCVIEVVVIAFFCVLTGVEIQLYFDNLERLKQYDSVVLLGFNAASVGIIKYCLDSINIDIKK